MALVIDGVLCCELSLQVYPMEPAGFLSHWQDAVTIGGYILFTAFIAWQIFSRSGPR